MTSVRLTQVEVDSAARIGVMRRVKSFKNAERAGHVEGDGWDIDVEGACAELAVAKVLDTFWGGHVEAYGEPDVVFKGCGLHVRWTHSHSHTLIVRPVDREKVEKLVDRFPIGQQRFVLVTGIAPTYVVRGSLAAAAALELTEASPYWKNPNGRDHAWFVPQSALEPLPALGPAFPARIP